MTTLKKLEEDTTRDARDDFNEYGYDQPRDTWFCCSQHQEKNRSEQIADGATDTLRL